MNYETWSIGEGESFLYTEDPDFASHLKKTLGKRCTTYERGGRVYAWQFLVRTKALNIILRQWEKQRQLKPAA